MLAKRRELRLDGAAVERTPLLVPSFSSKGFPEVANIVRATSELIDGPALVSAYDLSHGKLDPPFDFATLLFLDSGGYEASKDTELSDLGEREHTPLPWSRAQHDEVLAGWNPAVPTVLISYDHPHERLPIADQIERARGLAPNRSSVMREILLKPEKRDQRFLNVEAVLPHVHALAPFQAIGVTEKEIGNSLLARMRNIALLRRGLDKAGLDIPIHVFGSLDTITTPLYFLAGADIFDGLTWLRFAFHRGFTMYKHNYGALVLGLDTKAHVIDGRCWFSNYYYIKDMELEMRRFLVGQDFGCFQHHGNLFRQAYQSLAEVLEA